MSGLPEETYKPLVWVSTRGRKNIVNIRVRDNSMGIPDTVKAKVFQPFLTTKPTGHGTGVGLSLSYDIITKGHGSTLEVTGFSYKTS
ncbi:ATP-binding protein [Spirosoma spitsbergense]|uniref:ATP-binding protein n=1 Tax=Spirosoma spitsbergense TaxID=431554 RepID=UPI000A05653B|nr:ATP-binding protein [Spirosoma spitsbergense]